MWPFLLGWTFALSTGDFWLQLCVLQVLKSCVKSVFNGAVWGNTRTCSFSFFIQLKMFGFNNWSSGSVWLLCRYLDTVSAGRNPSMWSSCEIFCVMTLTVILRRNEAWPWGGWRGSSRVLPEKLFWQPFPRECRRKASRVLMGSASLPQQGCVNGQSKPWGLFQDKFLC